MHLKLARAISFFLVLLMCLQILGASAAALSSIPDDALTVHAQKPSSSFFGSLVFEKVEEERGEEQKDRMARAVLADFSRIAFSLSWYHTTRQPVPVLLFQYDVRPPVHMRHCVFLI